jgi:molecular chaperone Hsp33
MSNTSDRLIHALAADSTVRALAVSSTSLVAEACRRHRTAPTTSAALGRLLSGALLMGRTYKDLERLTLQVRGDGPVGTVVAEATAHGTVRGYVRNPEAELPPNALGKLDVKGVVRGAGGGMLHVIREAGYEIGLSKEPYYGSVPLVSGEIAEDLAHYLLKSEQINSAVSLGVFVEPDEGRVTAAGGFLIQAMPGVSDETVAALEASVARAPHVTAVIRAGGGPEELLEAALGDLSFDVLEEAPVEFRCTCSFERAVNIVSALDRAEVEDMLREDEGAEMTCHFCNEVYFLDAPTLENILAPPRLM